MASYEEQFKSKLDWAMPFQRTGKFPLDRTDLFSSYADAVKYAAGNTADPDERGLCGTSYIGQIITVFENDTLSVYVITATRTLAPVGSASSDNLSIELNSNNELQIKGFETADASSRGQMVVKKSDGTLAWENAASTTEIENAVTQANNYAVAAALSAETAKTYYEGMQGKFWFGTMEEYNAIPASEFREDGIYIIKDGFYNQSDVVKQAVD